MALIGALLSMNSLNLAEISKTIDKSIITPNIKKYVERNFLMMYLSRMVNLITSEHLVFLP